VEQLVCAAQRRIAEAAVARAASAPAPLLAIARVTEVAAGEAKFGADACRLFDHAARRRRIADDRGLPGAHDPGLLATDALAVAAEKLDVVDVDAGDHGALAVECVDGIESAAEPDLEDDEVERRRRQQRRD